MSSASIEGKALSELSGWHVAKQMRLERHSRAHRAHILNRRSRKRMRKFACAAYDATKAVNEFAKALESLNQAQ